MFKAVVLLARNDAMTRDEFRAWIIGGHAPLVAQLPGLRGFMLNLVDNDDAPYDAVSEVWFETHEAFEAAYATQIGRAVAADSLARLKTRIRLHVDEQAFVGGLGAP